MYKYFYYDIDFSVRRFAVINSISAGIIYNLLKARQLLGKYVDC